MDNLEMINTNMKFKKISVGGLNHLTNDIAKKKFSKQEDVTIEIIQITLQSTKMKKITDLHSLQGNIK